MHILGRFLGPPGIYIAFLYTVNFYYLNFTVSGYRYIVHHLPEAFIVNSYFCKYVSSLLNTSEQVHTTKLLEQCFWW